MSSLLRQEIHLSCDGASRRCLVHLPARAPQRDRSLLIFLHGAGATPQWALEETAWDRTADQQGFVLALPEALPLEPARPMSFLRNPSWWSDSSPVARAAHRDIDDVHFLEVLLEELAHRLSIDPGRIFLTGFSSGAAMTFRLAAESRVRLAAIAPVAGYCWVEDPRPPHSVPTCYLIGQEDPLVPLAGGRVRSPWGWQEERPPVQETIDRWTGALAGRGVFQVKRIPDLGHHWPGGRGTLSRRIFGPPCPEFKANEVIWDFCASLGAG